MASYGRMREDVVIQPISGKAFPVYKGEVLRITQVEGGQCVDFNAWNLNNSREWMDTSLMRRQGFHLENGDFLISNSPHNHFMMQIIHKSPVNIMNTIGHRCSAAMCEGAWGLTDHSNCQDSLAEAIREYGLTPDNVHGALPPWMPTYWDSHGHFYMGDNRAVKKGDHLDMLALMDLLTANCVCGITDYTGLGNYFPRPIRLQVFEPSRETQKMVEAVSRRYPPLRTQRSATDIPVKRGRDEDYKIKKVSGYRPKYINFPQKVQTFQVELAEEDYGWVQKLVKNGMRDDADDAIRSGVIEWTVKNRSNHHPLWGTIGQ